MYQTFEVNNFRCFSKLALPGLERVNLIAGKNNVGKTSLLEALFVYYGVYNPELAQRLSSFRGIEALDLQSTRHSETPWDLLFKELDSSKAVELIGSSRESGDRLLRLEVVSDPEELASIDQSIQYGPERPDDVPLSSGTTHVLKLESEGSGQGGSYYMILHKKGLQAFFRVVPPPPPPPFQTIFLLARTRGSLAQDAERFSKMEVVGQQDVLNEVLQVIEPRLRRLTVVASGGVSMIYGDITLDRLVPLALMGEGMTRLASLVLAIGNAQDGVVLVDEIENGLHHSVLVKVWQAIGEVARQFNTQVFATTHSLECVRAAHQAFAREGKYDFRLHRLDRTDGEIRAVTYEQDTLEAAIETGLEVR